MRKRETDRQREDRKRETDRKRQIERERQTERDKKKQKDRQKETKRKRKKDTERETERERQKVREEQSVWLKIMLLDKDVKKRENAAIRLFCLFVFLFYIGSSRVVQFFVKKDNSFQSINKVVKMFRLITSHFPSTI